MLPPPQLATTPRRPDRPSTGLEAIATAQLLGRPLLPWQRHTAMVAGELDDNGQHAYDTVVVSVGRRAGKSLLVLATMLGRAIGATDRRIWYTAQDRASAVLTYTQEWIPPVQTSPLAPLVTCRMSQGSEGFRVPGRQSFASVFAPTPTALHGTAGDLIVFDEAWVHSAERGGELMVAADPLTWTRPGAQKWIVSAAGDVDSTWLAEWLDIGRTAAAADVGRGICHLEWSADWPGADLDSPDVWIAAHPGVRHDANPTGTIPLERAADRYHADRAQFNRTFLNVTDREGVKASPFPADIWARLAGDWDRAGPVVLGVDCAADQASTTIYAAGGDPTPIVELVDQRPGHGWAPARLTELLDVFDVTAIVFDPGGPAGALAPDIRRLFGAPTELALRDVAAAAAGFVEAVRRGDVRHVPSPILDDAVAGARRRPVGDGSWTFDRRRSTTDPSPLVAATFARWAHPSVAGAVPRVG